MWLWPLKPLVGDATNRKYTSADAKPGFSIDIEISRERVTRQGRRYTAFGREVIVEWRPTVRRYYCPAAADLEITRAWRPNEPPDDPSWIQISADLVEAGYEQGELRRHTASQLLRLLRKVMVNVGSLPPTSDQAPDTHPLRQLFDSLGQAISELIDLDAKSVRNGPANIAAIQTLCKRVEAAVGKAHAAVESEGARAVVRQAHAAFLAAANAASSGTTPSSDRPSTAELLSAASQARGQLIIWFEEPVRRPAVAAEPARTDALDSLSNQLEQFVRSRDVTERARLKSSVLELSGSAEQICANWGDPDDVSSTFADLAKALNEDGDDGDVARLTRIQPIHSQIACWLEFRSGLNRLRELSKSNAAAINVFLAYGTVALNLADQVCQWFPFRVPGSDGVLTNRDLRKLDDGWPIPVEHGLLAGEISPRVVHDVRSTLLARAVNQARSFGESGTALQKLERVQNALDQLATALRQGNTGGIMSSPAGQELAAAITSATPLVVAKSGHEPENANAAPAVLPQTAEQPPKKRRSRVKPEVAIPLIRDHLLRHPTATVEEVSKVAGCSTGFVSGTQVWQLNQKRIRIARRMGLPPRGIRLHEKWLSDAEPTAEGRPLLDVLIEKLDQDENALFAAIGRFQEENPGSTPEQTAKAVGCPVGTVTRRQQLLEDLIVEQAKEIRDDQPVTDEDERPVSRKPPPVV